VFQSVVVITDRRILDRQLQDTIYQFEHKQGVVVRIDKDKMSATLHKLAADVELATPVRENWIVQTESLHDGQSFPTARLSDASRKQKDGGVDARL
jgi:type I restriction enzyme R subunit